MGRRGRTVNLSKGGQRFAGSAFIESYTATLSAGLAKENHLRGLDKPQFVARLAHHYNEFNNVHPFCEGSGRSTREFFGKLAKQAGVEIDQARIPNDAGQWNRASAAAFNDNLEPLQAILDHAVRPARGVAFERDSPAEAMRARPELKR